MKKNGWLGLAAGILGVFGIAAAAAPSKAAVCAASADGGAAKILPLGDSITYGYAGSDGGYRGPLYTLLRREGRDIAYVGSSVSNYHTATLPPDQWHNEGHGSYDIATLDNNLDGLDRSVFLLHREANRAPNGGHWLDGIDGGRYARKPLFPDAILLMIGTNDRDNPDGAEVRLANLIDKIVYMRPNAWLLVARIPPIRDTQAHGDFVAAYNESVDDAVARYAAEHRVRAVDMNTDFPVDGLSGDSIHPNDIGYAWIARQWDRALAQTLWNPAACRKAAAP